MKQLFKRLLQIQLVLAHSQSTGRENQGVVLLFSFLLALILWFLVTLNQNYYTTLSFPIQITQYPQGVQPSASHPPEINVSVEGLGVDLLLEHIKWNRKDTLSLRFQEEFKNGFFSPQKYISQLNRNLPNGLNIRQIFVDSVYYPFEQQKSKTVKLISKVKVQLDPALALFSQPILIPDSVTIVGPQHILDTIQVWYTEVLTTSRLSKATHIEVQIPDTFQTLSLDVQKAMLYVNPQFYTQTSLHIPIKISNIPANTQIRLDKDSIAVNLLVPIDKYEELLVKPVEIQLSYKDLDKEIPFIVPKIKDLLPYYVKSISHSPIKVSYVIVHQKI